MADIVKGTAHYYGLKVDDIVNATIISITPSIEFGRNEQTFNATGDTVEERWGDPQTKCTVVMRLQTGYAYPEIGADIVLSGFINTAYNTTYTLESLSEPQQNRGYIEQTMTLKRANSVSYL